MVRPDPSSVLPSHAPPHDLEHALRELVRNSPYVGVSLLLHGLVLLAFLNVQATLPEPDPDRPTLVATPEPPVEPLPPDPVPDEPIIEPSAVLDEPVVVTDEPLDLEPSELLTDAAVDRPFDSIQADSVIGLGGGPAEGYPGKLGSRGKPGGAPHQKTIADALDWLARHQHPAGYWSCEGFQDECAAGGSTPCTGRGSVHHDVGVTALALLAFLGAGETGEPDDGGRHQRVVKDGLRFLLDAQEPDGRFGVNEISTASYDHLLATLVVVEAHALTDRPHYQRAARHALAFTETLRNPGRAWRYLDRSDPEMRLAPDDVSVTGWAVMALTLARESGLDVPDQTLDDALLFVDELTDERGRTGYVTRGGGSSRSLGRESSHPADQTEAMTAVGLMCRLFADPYLTRDDLDDAGDVARGTELLLASPIVWDEQRSPGRIDFYYWYAATYAMFQRGGADWKRWEPGLSQVAAHQVQDGEAMGSWDPSADAWGHEGGRIYATALLTLLAEVYSRYERIGGDR